MKIAICSKTGSELSPVAARFARAEFFVIYDSKTLKFTSAENIANAESSGAGGKAVKILSDNDVDIVIGPEVGPKAFEALKAFEITAYNVGSALTVKDALYMYYEKKLVETTTPHAKSHK